MTTTPRQGSGARPPSRSTAADASAAPIVMLSSYRSGGPNPIGGRDHALVRVDRRLSRPAQRHRARVPESRGQAGRDGASRSHGLGAGSPCSRTRPLPGPGRRRCTAGMRQLRAAHAVATDPDPRTAAPSDALEAQPRAAAVAARRRMDPWLAAAIGAMALGLALRLTGLAYGLPDHFHWDEPTIMNRAIRMAGGDLNPHFFYYPTLLMYLLLVANGALYAVGHVLGFYASSNAFAVSFLTDSTASYLVGRGL